MKAKNSSRRIHLIEDRYSSEHPWLTLLRFLLKHSPTWVFPLTTANVVSDPNITRSTIAHRPSTVRNADRIVVLEEGAVKEQGTLRELLGRGGALA